LSKREKRKSQRNRIGLQLKEKGGSKEGKKKWSIVINEKNFASQGKEEIKENESYPGGE